MLCFISVGPFKEVPALAVNVPILVVKSKPAAAFVEFDILKLNVYVVPFTYPAAGMPESETEVGAVLAP